MLLAQNTRKEPPERRLLKPSIHPYAFAQIAVRPESTRNINIKTLASKRQNIIRITISNNNEKFAIIYNLCTYSHSMH